MLELKGVSKTFGSLQAVKNVSFTVNQGEILGLIGPNGAGKSTLIQLISGAEKPTTGEVFFQGKSITGKTPDEIAQSGLARTFQIVRVFKDMTVAENVLVGAMFAGKLSMSRAKERVEEVLEFTEMSHLQNKRVREITLPSQKRLQVARALAGNPACILLDEVMAGLNTKEVEGAIELVQRMRDTGISVLIIEHLMKVIMSISDRIIVLHHGELIAEGTPEEVSSDESVIAAYFGERYRHRMQSSNDEKRQGAQSDLADQIDVASTDEEGGDRVAEAD